MTPLSAIPFPIAGKLVKHEGPTVIRTARVSYRGHDRLDITRQGNDPIGRHFAPSWDILRPALAGMRSAAELEASGFASHAEDLRATTWEAYRPAFLDELRRSYQVHREVWRGLLDRDQVTLCCFCGDPARCHRTLVAEALEKCGATYAGEVGS